ncbi:MAG: UDP-3-O-(3-hydroxymyristoyl)glucosamine N-acyltransferase [Bacteroidales bacterium]|nr:UDP-3-O-(3-hydroxymyristoyl)glucosamine N-acyltransferase [Bacteroidales bacterium]
MKFNAKKIADYLNGEVEGDHNIEISTVARIEEGHRGALSFLSNMNYEKYIYTTKSSIVLVNRDFTPTSPLKATLIRVDNAYESFASLLQLYQDSIPGRKGIHKSAVIEDSAKIGEDIYIGAMAYIGENVVLGDRCSVYSHVSIENDTRIGEDSIFYSGVKVYHDSVIGKGCIIHAGSVIGSDGFGFAPSSANDYRKIPQVGNVILEDKVEVGANSVVDRATMGSTIIRKGVKIDNLVQIGHNVEIGENSVMAGQSGVAGSTKVGKNCMFGGQVGITGHVTIADGTKAAAQSGINSHIKKENTTVYGSPALEYRHFQKSYIVFRRLSELKDQVDLMAKEIKEIREG